MQKSVVGSSEKPWRRGAQAASKALENGHKKESLKEAFTALMTAEAAAVRSLSLAPAHPCMASCCPAVRPPPLGSRRVDGRCLRAEPACHLPIRLACKPPAQARL